MQVFNVYLYTIETYTDAFAVYEQVFVWYEARADLMRGTGAWKRLTLGPTCVQH